MSTKNKKHCEFQMGTVEKNQSKIILDTNFISLEF